MNILKRVKQNPDDHEPPKKKHHGAWTTINDAIKEAERVAADHAQKGKEEKGKTGEAS